MNLLYALFFSMAMAHADPGANGFNCKFVQEARTLTVLPGEGGEGCQLEYVKYGEKEIVATAKSGRDNCLAVMNKIKQKLESVGFTCEPSATP